MTIKYQKKQVLLLLLAIFLLFLTACSGGGGSASPQPGGNTSPQPQKVTVTFALQGSSDLVYSADLAVVLPESFVLELESGSIDQPSASALALLVTGAGTDFSYTPANAGINGEIVAAFIKSDGFLGNSSLMQISRTYVAGAILPTVDDFIVTAGVSDLDGNPLTGITAAVNIQMQPAP